MFPAGAAFLFRSSWIGSDREGPGPRSMRLANVKRSVVINGHNTSITLEDAFWSALREIAGKRGCTISTLVTQIPNAPARTCPVRFACTSWSISKPFRTESSTKLTLAAGTLPPIPARNVEFARPTRDHQAPNPCQPKIAAGTPRLLRQLSPTHRTCDDFHSRSHCGGDPRRKSAAGSAQRVTDAALAKSHRPISRSRLATARSLKRTREWPRLRLAIHSKPAVSRLPFPAYAH